MYFYNNWKKRGGVGISGGRRVKGRGREEIGGSERKEGGGGRRETVFFRSHNLSWYLLPVIQ